jgi:hypothetical protein
MNKAMLPIEQPSEEIAQTLERREKLLWFGAPRGGIRLRGSDLFAIPFSLLWGGFAICWEASVLGMPNSPWIARPWGVPFVLIGLYLIVGRFFVDARMRDSSNYAVTDRRVLILSGLFRRENESLILRNVPEISVVQARDNSGSGTISFGSLPSFAAFSGGFAGWPGGRCGLPPQFEMIVDVAAVAALARDAQRRAVP